jgi:hypothetical protein
LGQLRPENESGLSKIALDWMIQEAKRSGAIIDPAKEAEVLGRDGTGKYIAPDPNGPAHESLTGAWNLAEFIPKTHYNWSTGEWKRRMNLYRRRTMPPASLVHDSVFLRSGGYRSRLPPDAVRVIA